MGIIYSIGAAIFFSLSVISVRRGVSQLGIFTGTVIMLSGGAVFLFFIALAFDNTETLMAANFSGFFFFAIAGVIHFVGGWGFQNASASRIGATHLSAMASVTPLFAALLAFLFMGERVNAYIMAGISLIVFGVYLITTSDKQ